jgi:hypothetical protein
VLAQPTPVLEKGAVALSLAGLVLLKLRMRRVIKEARLFGGLGDGGA